VIDRIGILSIPVIEEMKIDTTSLNKNRTEVKLHVSDQVNDHGLQYLEKFRQEIRDKTEMLINIIYDFEEKIIMINEK
jgi:hypothetical protein